MEIVNKSEKFIFVIGKFLAVVVANSNLFYAEILLNPPSLVQVVSIRWRTYIFQSTTFRKSREQQQ